MGEDSHGNSPLAATPVPADGALIAGCLETPGDVDFFLFSAVGGRRLLLQTSHLSPEMDSILYLFGADGQTILAVDNDSGGSRASRIEWTAPTSGTYFVMVHHAQATSGTGCYDLSIGMVQTDDHGDTAAAATAIPSDGSPVAGFIETPTDVDFFLFAAEAGWVYVIETSNLTAGMNTVLALYDRDGQTLVAQDDDSGAEGASRIVFQSPLSGTYSVAAAHSLTNGTGGYELSVAKEGYGDDHGGDAASATALLSGNGVLGGRIEVPEDVDAFSFPATAEGEYTFSLVSRSDLDVAVSLYRLDGMTLLWDEALARTGKSRRSWTAPASGTYLVSVHPARGGTTGAYAVDLASVLKLREVGSFGASGYSVDVRVDKSLAYLIVGVTSAGALRAWKVDVKRRGSEEPESRWYAPGVGVVKLARQSRSYELADASLLRSGEVVVLEASAGGGAWRSAWGARWSSSCRLSRERPTRGGWGLTWTLRFSLLSTRGVSSPTSSRQPRASPCLEPSTSARAAKGTPSGPVSLELLYARTWDEEPTYRVMVTALVR
jgi:hypothetical protein